MSKVLNLQNLTTNSTTSTMRMMMPSKKSVAAATSSSSSKNKPAPVPNRSAGSSGGGDADMNSLEFDDITSSSSILEFLSTEQECCMEDDAESIFQEVSRLADDSDTRSVDEILREAELLIQNQPFLSPEMGVAKSKAVTKRNAVSKEVLVHLKPKTTTVKINSKYTKKIENVSMASSKRGSISPEAEVVREKLQNNTATAPTLQTPTANTNAAADGEEDTDNFNAFIGNIPSDSVLSEESTPNDFLTYTATENHLRRDNEDDTDDGTDTMEEITEGLATIELLVSDGTRTTCCFGPPTVNDNDSRMQQQHSKHSFGVVRFPAASESTLLQHLTSPVRRPALNFNATQACSPVEMHRSSSVTRSDSMHTPDSGISSHSQSTQTPRRDVMHDNSAAVATSTESPPPYDDTDRSRPIYSNKAVNTSPMHLTTSATSPIEAISTVTREHALKQDIDLLQEKLKDTEERLQSLRIQHDSLSQLHRDLRESNTHLQEQSEVLKLDVQHLNECANVLRSELQSSRLDRSEALELQRVLQAELEESRQEKKRVLEQHEKGTKTIQDLQRQCREMERILMRKHPDSVSALIVASKNPGKLINREQENVNSRKLLEQRIAQLESDAKEQDKKAQQILANVQARFNSVQSKYETHIGDLEMQVLSLQDINTKLNEKIESQVRTLNYFVAQKAEKYYNNCTQTDPTPLYPDRLSITQQSACNNANKNHAAATQTAKTNTRDHSTNTIASVATTKSHPLSASSSTSSTANSTPNNSRPNSKQSVLRKTAPTANGTLSTALVSKLPVSRSDSTISVSSYAKEDAHLLATVRSMRVDLAIKDKAMQRLSRELDECKRTIRKLQKDATKMEKSHAASSSSITSRRVYDASVYPAAGHDQKPANTENHALKEAQNKIKLLEADYKSLHDKRLQDLKTLQSAHERELSSCHETVRILQQRLNERDEAFAMQTRRKMPVDYYALKAKVSSLERRHSEREDRLHLLVEALSKGRLNGALEELLSDNNNA